MVDAGHDPTYEEKMRAPPPPLTGVYAHCSMTIPTTTKKQEHDLCLIMCWWTVCVMYLNIAWAGLTKPLRTRNEFLFNSLCHKRAKTAKRDVSAKHFSEFTQLFLVFICTCVIILKVTRFYLNLERKATMGLHRLCLSIHVFHADWYPKKARFIPYK